MPFKLRNLFSTVALNVISLSCATYPDWAASISTGLTLSAENKRDEAERSTNPSMEETERRFGGELLILASPVPTAEHIKTIQISLREWHPLKLVFGRWLGTANNDHELRQQFESQIVGIEARKGHFLIINNVQIESNTNYFMEFWNNWSTSLLFYYSEYTVVAEAAWVREDEIDSFLSGKQVSQITTQPETRIVFRGIVHSLAGREIIVASARTDAVRPGLLVSIRDRTGREVGTAKVEKVFHTQVKIRLESGESKKGYTVLIFN